MNGLSLLVALAAVGVDVGWESTSTGKLAYTIRIESILIDRLGDGSDSIECVIDKSDRGLRKFRVVVGPKNLQTERVTPTTANAVQYGWRPNEAGGINYYVQISRERLESLARGFLLECDVLPEVPEIEKIYVFVGDTTLPRELPQGVRNLTTPPRDISTVDPRGSVTQASGTDTNANAPRYGTSGYGTQGNTQVTVGDPNRNNGYGTQPTQGNLGNNQTYGPAPASGYRDPAPGRYGQYGDNTLPIPPLDNSRPDYGYGGNQYAPQDQYTRPQQQTYSPPLAQTATLPPQQPQYAPQQYAPQQPPTTPVTVQQPPASAATSPSMDALTAAVLALQQKQTETTKPPVVTEAKSVSSKPLILTTLALFASIGANAYLGWLAWSFFWRFRDTASDLSRARSNAFPAGSIAGH